MNKQPRHERIEQLFNEALALDPHERSDFLKRSCSSDPALLAEVQSLLSEHERTGTFMGSPAYEINSELLVAPEGSLAGKSLGHFSIQERIGAGGMGEVYRARDTKLGREVAIKVLSEALTHDTLRLKRFEREARMLASLNHSNIATIHSLEEFDGIRFIVMELLPGETLDDRIDRGALPLREALIILSQTAAALQAAHEKGIIHRDLKPANIQLLSGRTVKVLDFGLAKAADVQPDPGVSTMDTVDQSRVMIAGTPAYLSPEQVRGELLDTRADVWAFGCVAYEALTGEKAFRGKGLLEIAGGILNLEPDWSKIPATTPGAISELIKRCMEKDRERRLPDITSARNEIEQALQNLDPTHAGTVAPWAGLRHALSRRPWLALAAALTLASVTGAAALLNVGGLRQWLPWRTAGPKIESLVVLPLTNLSGDPAQEHVADGMTEALIAELSKVGGLKVVSRTSTMQYKGAKKPLGQIVRELRVDGVVEGGILREGELVRVTVQLIDGRTDKSLWAQSFDRETRGILTLQSDVVRAIAGELKVKLSPQEEALLARARPVNPEAYEAYLKGRMHWYKQTPQDVDTALQYFESALKKDPTFPLGSLGMAYVWAYQASAGLLPPGEARKKLTAAIQTALVFDPVLAEAHEGLANFNFYYDWDWATAEKGYKRAIELMPNSADMRLNYWEFLAAMKRLREAQMEIERCLELDPLNSFVQMMYGIFLLSAHRFDDSIVQFRKILETGSDFGPAYLGLWQAYHHKGMQNEALAAAKDYFGKWGDEEMAEILAAGHKKAGYRGAMRVGAEELAARFTQSYILPTQVAVLYAYAGEKDRALDWLEKAFEQRETGLVKMQIDPDWDSLRDQPRFKDLLQRMNFPPS